MSELEGQHFWNEHYSVKNTPWDIGYVSPAMIEAIDQIKDKRARILIPGAGNAYEARYLVNQGFTNITICDIAPLAVDNFKLQYPDWEKVKIIVGDFFEMEERFDYILEQTFFCALPRELRTDYARKMAELLEENGVLTGLLFSIEFPKAGPPFGGSMDEYLNLFSPYFRVEKMEITLKSIPQRQGNEIFIKLIKK